MILFIVIFFVMVIVVSVAAVAGFSFYLKRRTKAIETINPKQFIEPPYRSLFEPDAAELRAEEREAQMRVEAERKEIERKAAAEKIQKAADFEKIWRVEPHRQNTIELLRLAAMSSSAEIFSQTAENVIQKLLHEQAGDLSKRDLADLLDSHFRTLPQQERTSGALFWLRREIESLRGKSE